VVTTIVPVGPALVYLMHSGVITGAMKVLPPTYLDGRAALPDPDGPARHLVDGRWCGHGEPRFAVFDLRGEDGGVLWHVQVPADLRYPALPAVRVSTAGGDAFLAYDPREHPASVFVYPDRTYPYRPAPLVCPSCSGEEFRAAVGFEIPGDAEDRNDVSWFALAVECSRCDWSGIIFDDETA
jgi:hypothetical protein